MMKDYIASALQKVAEDILAQAQRIEPVIGDLHAFASSRYHPTGTIVESTSIPIDEAVLALPPRIDRNTDEE